MRRLGWVALLVVALSACGIGEQRAGAELARALGLPADVGPICGSGAILGEKIGDVSGRGGCGIDDAVRVSAVGGVRLRPSARLNCRTAAALQRWVAGPAQAAARRAGTGITDLRVAASYACRRRNNRPNGPLSEHAKGNAIDISEVQFSNGDRATVLRDWGQGPYAEVLQTMHRSACGPFGVVLGPRADRFHQDHFHFDISHRNARYCR